MSEGMKWFGLLGGATALTVAALAINKNNPDAYIRKSVFEKVETVGIGCPAEMNATALLGKKVTTLFCANVESCPTMNPVQEFDINPELTDKVVFSFNGKKLNLTDNGTLKVSGPDFIPKIDTDSDGSGILQTVSAEDTPGCNQ